jgi:hypothetical protein
MLALRNAAIVDRSMTFARNPQRERSERRLCLQSSCASSGRANNGKPWVHGWDKSVLTWQVNPSVGVLSNLLTSRCDRYYTIPASALSNSDLSGCILDMKETKGNLNARGAGRRRRGWSHRDCCRNENFPQVRNLREVLREFTISAEWADRLWLAAFQRRS